jgi:hypothetical protein
LLFFTYVGALAVLDAEQNVTGSNIRNIGNAVWWALCDNHNGRVRDSYPHHFGGQDRRCGAGWLVASEIWV